MQTDMKKLSEEKRKVEHDLKQKVKEEGKRSKEVEELKGNYDAELKRIINESKKLAMGNLQKLKKAERALVDGAINEDDDISLPDRFTPFMDGLSRPLSRITPWSESSSRAASAFSENPSRAASSFSAMNLEDIKFDDLKIEDMDIELLLAQVKPAPSAFKAVTPRSSKTPSSMSKSPVLPSKSPSVLSTPIPALVSCDSPSMLSEADSTISNMVSSFHNDLQFV